MLSVSRARCSVPTQQDEGSVSVSLLNRHIHTLRKRIRRFEEHFEQERHYKVREEIRPASLDNKNGNLDYIELFLTICQGLGLFYLFLW